MENAWEEAVARIKGEVLAADWRLNRRRGAALGEALRVVAGELAGRRAALSLVEMARVALAYQEQHGEGAPPPVLDFLKQALAQVIAVIEEEDISAEEEAEIFNKVHLAFLLLKRQLALTPAGKAV